MRIRGPNFFTLRRLSEITHIDRRNLKLTPGRRLYLRRHFYHIVGIEIQPLQRHNPTQEIPVSLLNVYCFARLIETYHSIALGILHLIGEHYSITLLPHYARSVVEHSAKALPVEYIVAEHEHNVVITDKNPLPIMNACASPSGRGCSAYSNLTPRRLPSPSRRLNAGKSSGVDIINISRMPASISTDTG